MRDELIYLQFALEVVVDEIGQLGAAFDAAERAAFPVFGGLVLSRAGGGRGEERRGRESTKKRGRGKNQSVLTTRGP